ncbi:MAG TPA: preprotein translocase subunit SecE [Steroidobacteraceae bacterium]|nr:preprotein translocase subunit SecE [Steroidobacteraceae bacterium]
MMEKSEQQGAVERDTNALDVVLMAIAVAALIAGLWAFYHYEDVEAAWLRWLIVLGALVASVLIALTSQIGRNLWGFVQGSRVELRKVVWPSRDETVKTTAIVFFFVTVAGLFFWGLDVFLSWLAKKLTGAG